jgi:hypothetical protein
MQCSIYIIATTGGFSEFGWVQGQNSCNTTTYKKPVASLSGVGAEKGSVLDDCYVEWKELKEYHGADSWTYGDNPPVVSGDSSACNVTIHNAHWVKDAVP